ncbi:hypothetical protein PAPYR_10932 [Paratrimastix pyriformis]|uniref:Guanine nucleotide-binding protein subunit beta-like protein n=1 Tax=Paratrimastix pyriformis TaxID=342808 RepID=A0ABQ8U4W1_9EUKA|nr:hypothetical protein PAPYR_10932 [Paratrimastix pyriformis]
MKLTVTLELTPEEAPQIRDLFATLQKLSATVNVTGIGKQAFLPLLRMLGENESSDITDLILQRLGDGTDTALRDAFTEALLAIISDTRNGPQQRLANSFRILSFLPPDTQHKIVQKLVPSLLAVFNKERPPNCKRSDFLGHAEALACLSRFNLVDMNGLVRMINHYLEKETTQAVGCAVIIKAIEQCGADMKQRCDPAVLAEMANYLLTKITTEYFRAEQHLVGRWLSSFTAPPELVAYADSLNRLPLPAAAAAAAAAAVAADTSFDQAFQATTTQSATNMGFSALGRLVPCRAPREAEKGGAAAEEAVMAAVSLESTVEVWNPRGEHLTRWTLPAPYRGATGLEWNGPSGHLLICSNTTASGSGSSGSSTQHNEAPADGATSHALLVLPVRHEGGGECPRMAREAIALGGDVTAVKLLPGGSHFVAGVTASPTSAQIQLFDMAALPLGACESLPSGGSSQTGGVEGTVRVVEATPVIAMDADQDSITALAYFPDQHLFVSGSRNATVLLWDSRSASQAASLPKGRTGHQDAITSLAAHENYLLTGSLDRKVLGWDVRRPDRPCFPAACVDDTAILCLEWMPYDPTRGVPLAAVGTSKGLSLLDPTTSVSSMAQRRLPPHPRRMPYLGLQWAREGDRGYVYACGPRIEKFELY